MCVSRTPRLILFGLLLGAIGLGAFGASKSHASVSNASNPAQSISESPGPAPSMVDLQQTAPARPAAPGPAGTPVPVAPPLQPSTKVFPPIPRQNQDPKLASQLAELRDANAYAMLMGQPNGINLPAQLPDELKSLVQGNMMKINGAGQVQVYVKVAAADATLLETLVTAGVTVERVSDDLTLVQGWVSPNALSALAAVAAVESVRLPDYGFVQTGSVTTEGDAIIRADLVRSTFGVTGAGVKVGVISDGVGGLSASQASGDLGAVDTTTCNSVGGDPTASGAEATAMLEIVHDIAPDAQLYFGHFESATSGTDLDFNAAVTCLAAHTDVVIDDISWFNDGHYDGTSTVSTSTSNHLNLAGNPIRLYSTSVGNYSLEHYRDTFVDTNDGYHDHKFQATAGNTIDWYGWGPLNNDAIYLFNGERVDIYLQWSDTWGTHPNDYDLGLWSFNAGAFVAWSTTGDTTSGNPIESIDYPNTGADGQFGIVIRKVNGSARTFDMYVLGAAAFDSISGPHMNYYTPSRSVPNQADASNGVISVGAIDQADPGHDTIEYFSSLGPTIDNRTKPDITAIDGVTVTGDGGFGSPFYGTSAASPHVGAVAALLLQCRPDLKSGGGVAAATARTNLKNYILNSAVDLGTAGVDNTYGSGRLDAYAAAVAAGCAAPTATPTSTRTATPTPTSTRTPTPTSSPTPAVPKISIESAPVLQGGTVTVRVETENVPAPGLGNYAVDVSYDGSVVYAASCLSNPSGVMDSANCDVATDRGSNIIHLTGSRTSTGATGTVPLGDVTFNATGSVGSISALNSNIGAATFQDTSNQDIPMTAQNGSIRISVRGDISGDGGVSMVDAMRVAQCVVGIVDCTSAEATMGDVNCSGGMSMVDAMLIAQYVVGLIQSLPCS